MGSIAVRVENLGKQYRIGRVKPSYGTTPDYAEVEVILEFEQWVGRGELRPS